MLIQLIPHLLSHTLIPEAMVWACATHPSHPFLHTVVPEVMAQACATCPPHPFPHTGARGNSAGLCNPSPTSFSAYWCQGQWHGLVQLIPHILFHTLVPGVMVWAHATHPPHYFPHTGARGSGTGSYNPSPTFFSTCWCQGQWHGLVQLFPYILSHSLVPGVMAQAHTTCPPLPFLHADGRGKGVTAHAHATCAPHFFSKLTSLSQV